MNTAVRVFLSMSISGGLLTLALLLGKRLWRNRLSRQWQYYIWLVVVLRLLLPFAPETTLMGTVWQMAEQSGTRAAAGPQIQQDGPDVSAPGAAQAAPAPPSAQRATENVPQSTSAPAPETLLCGVWLAAALALLVRKITLYQSFVRGIRARAVPVADTGLLDRLSALEEWMGVRKPVELCVNPLAASPMLVGLFRPCIVLPNTMVSGEAFDCIALHELTHYRRRDIVYKWLVQITVCLHWFNPAVYLMSREIERECEFSCDEAVLARTGYAHAPAYGKTLLDAMPAAGIYREPLASASLSENKKLLKERLNAMMHFGKKSKAVRLLTGVLTACILAGAVFLGACQATPQNAPEPTRGTAAAGETASQHTEGDSEVLRQMDKAYEDFNVLLFQSTFSRLTPEEQISWLQKTYRDGNYAFFSLCLNQQKDGGSREEEGIRQAMERITEQSYEDNSLSFFSMLADRMTADELALWLERAKEDEKLSFEASLLDKLGRDEEKDELDREWEERQRAEYEAVGITADGKNYYYFGQLVNVFLDIRSDKKHYTYSYYMLDVNPKGTVNIQIRRDNNGKILGVSTLTQEEADLYLSTRDEEEEMETEPGTTTIPVNAPAVRDGETIWLGTYTLADGDRVSCYVTAQTGRKLTVGFADADSEEPGQGCQMLSDAHETGAPEVISEPMEWPAGPGEYRLFIRAEDGPLADVTGYVEILQDNPE